MQSEFESEFSSQESNFHTSTNSSRSADGIDSHQSYDLSSSATHTSPGVSAKWSSTWKSNEINMGAFREADRIHVRSGVATRFGTESAMVKLE